MWKFITIFLCIFCINNGQATYNTGIKTRVYTTREQPITQVVQHHYEYVPTHGNYHQQQPHQQQQQNSNCARCDNDYQTSITHHQQRDSSYQQQPQQHQQQQRQNEGDYYQSTPNQAHFQQESHRHYHEQQQQPQQQPQPNPIFNREDANTQPQSQTTGNWLNSKNSINEFYTGCPAGYTGQLPYAYDCRRFLNCWHGRGHIQTCSVGTVFNAETLECDRPDKARCEVALGVLGQTNNQLLTQGHLKQPQIQPNYRAGRYTDVSTDSVEVLCPPDAKGLQPHPSDCTRFINCANGNVHIQQCGPGTAFSIVMKVCDYKDKVDCSGREGSGRAFVAQTQDNQESSKTAEHEQHEELPHTNDILCPKGITGLFAYPFDYTKFLHCKNGNTAIQNCVPGTAFSISKGYCESLENIQSSDHVIYIVSQVSYEYSQTLITCPPGTEGLHLYPFNAEKFVKCIQSQMEIVPCSVSQVFSTIRRQCLPTAQVLRHERVRLLSDLQNSIDHSGTEEHFTLHKMVYCPRGLTGTYPNPFDSTKYLKCVQGRIYSESCASGQAYSLSHKVCSPKEELNVVDRVPLAKLKQGREWNLSDMETTHGSIDGLTYLMCPPGLDGYYLHPFDCTKYIECRSGATIVDECTQGTVFSISRQECIPRDKVEAYDRVEYMITTTNEFSSESANHQNQELGITCSPGTFGIYPHPHNFHKYMRCANGRLSVENCPVGQVFSVARSFCHSENEVAPNDRSSYNPITTNTNTVHQTGSFSSIMTPTTSLLPPPRPQLISPPTNVLTLPIQSAKPTANVVSEVTCPEGATGRYAHPYDCTKFLMCTNGETHVQACGPGTAWSRAMEVCDFIDNVKECSTNSLSSSSSTTTVITAQSPYVCPAGIEGLYQHPYDWHKYLVCNHGQTTVMDCAPGTVFSISRRICDLEANVLNSDRCNNGIYSSNYDYSYGQGQNTNTRHHSSTQWSYVDPQRQPFTHTQVTENRWTNMNVPRPEIPTVNWRQTSHTHRMHSPAPPPARSDVTPVWSGTAQHVDQRNPTHTIIYEEGSLEPNRNYKTQMFNTPLAPLKPPPTTSTSTTSTVVYAQPIGSQEDSQEIFSNKPPKTTNIYYPPPQLHSVNRQNHTRHINTWTPMARPVDMPRHDLMPNPTHQGTVYTNTRVLVPVVTHFQPSPSQPPRNRERPLVFRQSIDEEEFLDGQAPLAEGDFKITTINIDEIPGQRTYNFDDVDQLPAASSKHNVNDASNLYGGLQPPLPNKPTTAKNVPPPFEQTTQIPKPAKTTTPTTRIAGYPQLSNATIQTFPHQPHYSPPYSEVTYSRNATWVGRKLPTLSNIKPIHGDHLSNDNKNIKITSPRPSTHYYDLNPPPFDNREHDENDNIHPDDEQVMKQALKLLLKPYLDPEAKVVDDSVAKKAQSHIMSLVTTPTTITTTTTSAHLTPSNKNTLAPFTTTTHQPDAELIIAGEQHGLVGVTTSKTGNHETSTAYNLYQTPLEFQRSSASPNQLNHDHNSNWQKHHNHNHNSRHHSKSQHNREFHEKHPNLPNPFVEIHNPRSESTTPRNYDFDLRVGGQCPFDCGYGKCIEQHQVCDGVNNCGNRKDEQQCDHLGYDLRLTGGESSHMGRVEVKILGKWGYVCDDKFGLRDADVVCHELGFKMGAMEVRGNSYYPPTGVNLHFVMDEVECKGNETSLQECDFKGWGVNNCGPDEVVGVVCKVPKLKCPDNYWLCSTSKECIPTAFLCDVTPDCEDGSDESEQVCNAPIKYRLEGGRSSNEGRLEVFYRGEWGTVCDDDFGLKEAQVVCNSFGLYGKPDIIKNIYGPGSGPIWLDQVSCFGNETKIDECNHWSWGENNCNHTEDVGLKCKAGPKPPTKLTSHPSDRAPVKDSNFGSSSTEFEQSELDDLGLYQGLWQRSSKAINSQKKCGHFKSDIVDEYDHPEERVVNGSKAKRGRHPWQATIRTRGRGGISSHWCGAVIISKKLILTAAHCLAGYPKGSYFVRMGDHYANIAESSEIDVNIENWYIHEKFRDQKHMNNDIALILLKSPIRFNDYIQPICLPEKGAVLETSRMCTISGWGSIKSGTSTPSNILRSAQVPILADEVCHQKNVYNNAMTEGMFCAGFLDESADACDGDSGGPLVCSDEDGETLYGIISWGQHCGYANHPGVYVKVEKYIDWIYDKINLMLQQKKL